MPKRHHHSPAAPYPMGGTAGWSVGSNGLTQSGQAELLRQLGQQLQTNYQSLVDEPTPDRFRQLLARLEQRRQDVADEQDFDEEEER